MYPDNSMNGRNHSFERMLQQPVRTRAYYASSVEEAVERATCDMGPDAMLVNTRKAPPEARHVGEYEVVFSLPEDSKAEPRSAAPVSRGGGELAREMAKMRSEIGDLLRMVVRRSGAEEAGAALPSIRERMREEGFEEGLTNELLAAADRDLLTTDPGPRDPGTSVAAELRRRIAEVQTLPTEPEPRAVAVAGPPGCGKTTLLVKLAAMYSASSERIVTLLNTDTFRIGAAEQMARYASILNLRLETADTPAGWRQALAAGGAHGLVLIDTPGLSGSAFSLMDPLAAFLAARDDIQVHLVLPATMRARDLARSVGRYQRFRPRRLAFTRLDETSCFGPLLSSVCNSAIPASWISAGQQVPDDLEAATVDSLVRLFVPLAVDAGAGVHAA